MRSHARRIEFDCQYRRSGRGFDPHIRCAGNPAENLCDLHGHPVEHIEVGAIDADGELGRFARERFADAVAEESQRFGLERGILAEGAPDCCEYGFLTVRAAKRQLNMQLALVRRKWVLAGLGAADLLLDRGNPRYRHEIAGKPRSRFAHPANRCTGRTVDLQHIVSLTKRRQQFAAEGQQSDDPDQANDRSGTQNARRTLADAG